VVKPKVIALFSAQLAIYLTLCAAE